MLLLLIKLLELRSSSSLFNLTSFRSEFPGHREHEHNKRHVAAAQVFCGRRVIAGEPSVADADPAPPEGRPVHREPRLALRHRVRQPRRRRRRAPPQQQPQQESQHVRWFGRQRAEPCREATKGKSDSSTSNLTYFEDGCHLPHWNMSQFPIEVAGIGWKILRYRDSSKYDIFGSGMIVKFY